MNTLDRARAYLAKLPPAIAGQAGHKGTFVAACRLREFGLNESDALAALREWNLTHCRPPWPERDLRHKIADAFRVTVPKETFTLSSQREQRSATRRTLPPWESELPQKRNLNTAAIESKWPISNPSASFFDTVTSNAHFSTLANLRGLSVAGVKFAADRGLLRFGTWRTRLAWFILDNSGRIIQARRLDGRSWVPGVKAWTLPGSQAAWPVGITDASAFPAIALCEGSPDLLAACSFIVGEERERDVAPVTMLGGCARIHTDALPLFHGKRVRIFAHLDDTGDNATDRWAEQLDAAGAMVDGFRLTGLQRTDGAPLKDLCDLAAIHADDFEKHRCLWNLFDYAPRT